MNENTEIVPPDQFKSVVRRERSEIQPIDPSNPSDILRYAIDSGMTAESLERMMAVRRELVAEKAAKEFSDALAAFQAECPIITKRKYGAKQAYRYSPLDHIIKEVKPLLQKHGFSYSVTCVIEGDKVKAICRVKHQGGHSEVSEFPCPVDAANPMMTAPQRFGGALTFAKRYAFTCAFGILTADEDTDGGVAPKPAGPSTMAGDKPKRDTTETAMKQQLVELTREYHGAVGFNLDANQKGKLLQYLANIDAVGPFDTLDSLSGGKLKNVIEKIKKLKP